MNDGHAAIVPLIAQTAVRVEAPDRSRTWRRVTLSAAACVTLLDAVLLQRKHGVFTGGFLATHPFGTVADGAAFVGLIMLLNVTVTAPLTLAAVLLARRLRLRLRAVQFAAFCAAVLPLTIADFVRYQVWWYLGDAFDFHLMYNLTGQRASEIFAVVAPLMSPPLFMLAAALSAIAGGTWLLHRFVQDRGDIVMLPTAGALAQRCLALVLLSSLVVTAVAMTSDSMGFALRWTPTGQLFTTVLNRLSDVDRDGYGVLQNPRDSAPWNPNIQPYAIDIPGNGFDENGLGGDLPLESAAATIDRPILHAAWPKRPPVIVFVLESMRADVVGAVYSGHQVTPVMDRLAAEGVSVASAWSHNGVTGQSRYHILTGSLVYGRGNSTLLNDFKDHGYEVAYFSGQNDDFGNMGIDYRPVDKYYDARQDMASRYTTSTSPGSVAVPITVVEKRVREYLAERQGKEPLFLFVNFHDTHYPYSHSGLENLLGVEPLPASLISPARRPELRRTYLNTVANVDRAIGRVIDNVEAEVGQRPAVVVLSDHGESLFEQGFLGHGYTLNEAQMRIPFIVRGLPINIRTPFGQTDLRGALNEALAKGPDAGERPVVRQNSHARVFQYLGTLDTPMQLGWMTAGGPFTYDFRSERVGVWDGTTSTRDLIGEPRRTFQELVYMFESILLARRQTPPPDSK